MMAISLYGFSIEMLYVEICISETRRKSRHLRNGEFWYEIENCKDKAGSPSFFPEKKSREPILQL